MPGAAPIPSLDFASSSAAAGGKTGAQLAGGVMFGSKIITGTSGSGGGLSPLFLGVALGLGGWWLWRKWKKK
jgi:hypothetical protein